MKDRPLEELLNKYCSDFNLDPKKMGLFFDGELLNIKVQTPTMLEMEDEDVVDVRELKKNS